MGIVIKYTCDHPGCDSFLMIRGRDYENTFVQSGWRIEKHANIQRVLCAKHAHTCDCEFNEFRLSPGLITFFKTGK